jgi:hypothetical protein
MIIKGQQLCVPVFSLRSLSSVEHEADAKHWSWRLLSSERSFCFLRSCSGLPYSRKYRLTYCPFYPCSEWSLWGDECHTVPSALCSLKSPTALPGLLQPRSTGHLVVYWLIFSSQLVSSVVIDNNLSPLEIFSYSIFSYFPLQLSSYF